MRRELFFECSKDRAHSLGAQVFRRCAVAFRGEPGVAVDVVRRHNLASAIVEAAFLSAAFTIGLDNDRSNAMCRFTPDRLGQGCDL